MEAIASSRSSGCSIVATRNLVGTPSGYRFDVSQPGAIVNSGNLELSPGEDLTLTGGTVIRVC